MLIESTEHFHAAAGIAIQRGANEVAESDYEQLPAATRTKLRILERHGVVRLHSQPDLDVGAGEPVASAASQKA